MSRVAGEEVVVTARVGGPGAEASGDPDLPGHADPNAPVSNQSSPAMLPPPLPGTRRQPVENRLMVPAKPAVQPPFAHSLDRDPAAIPTDEIDIVVPSTRPISRTTILKAGEVGEQIAPERRLVRGSDVASIRTPSDSGTSPADQQPDSVQSGLVAATRQPPPPPPPAPQPPPPPPPTRRAPMQIERSTEPEGMITSGVLRPTPVERAVVVPPRREASFATRSHADDPFPAHAPPVVIRRTRRRSSLGLVVTLLVLGGLIAAAIVFGGRLLFSNEWSDDARPYGEAVEQSMGIEFAERPDVDQVAPDALARGLLDRFGGPWRDELPMWRSLGLASGDIDEATLAGLLAGWQSAYFDPGSNTVEIDRSSAEGDADADVVTAMATAALDQTFDWVDRRDAAGLELRVLIDAQVQALASEAGAATEFGVPDQDRPIETATYLPPILAYRIHGPVALGDLVIGDGAGPDVIAPISALGSAPAARLSDGDVLDATHPTDRAFWYLTLASYVGPRRAYDASNALSLATLTTATSGDITCTYVTFSGTSPERTASLAAVLDDWVAAAPAAMDARSRTRGDGVLQLRTCDPGTGFESGSRFGVARELVRWRLVELAVRERSLTLGRDPDVAIAELRLSGAGERLLGGPFDVSPDDERASARQIASELLGG